MKKSILILVLLVINFEVFSQSKTSLGFRLGFNNTTITRANLDPKFDVYGGVFLTIKHSELYTLQPEIGYSGQGGKAKNNFDENINTNYITLTAANKFFVKNTGLHFIIAPSIIFDFDDTFIGLLNRVHGNDVTFIDFMITGGVGFEFKKGFGIEARYNQGLIDVFSGSWHSFSSSKLQDETQFNSVFQLGVSYRLNLSKKNKVSK